MYPIYRHALAERGLYARETYEDIEAREPAFKLYVV